METMTKRPKLKVDLIAELDKVTAKNPTMKPHEIRTEIGHIFSEIARSAGWNFRHEIWPALRVAVEASINSTEENEILGYIENLTQYCESAGRII